jgi:4-amino-4-deoxy-L-arabinose transferase-like glycosyltransferase
MPILLGGFLPGVIVGVPYLRSFLAPCLPVSVSPSRSSSGGFWLLSGLWCVFFFSCSGSKLPTYILPAFPPLCLALGEFVARTRWNDSWAARGLITGFAVVVAGLHFVFVPWYAEQRSPMGRPELVEQYVTDPSAVVVAYPRNVDSVAFYTGRADLKAVRTKDLNQCLVDCHFRPRTVFLFTHSHSLAAFREALPPSLRIAEAVSLRRSTGQGKLADKLVGATPWGLCDIAVVEPVGPVQCRHVVTSSSQ